MCGEEREEGRKEGTEFRTAESNELRCEAKTAPRLRERACV